MDSTITLTFDFNDHVIEEKNHKTTPTFYGVQLCTDRFGNERSAVLMRGDRACYLSLGTSKLLKSPNMSISFWVNLYRRNYQGTGNIDNPLIVIKNGPGEDFINAIAVIYNPRFDRVGVNSTKDSTYDVVAMDDKIFEFNKWHHFVVVCNNYYLALYADGVLKQKTRKSFETKFLETDSMVVGHTASKKNERMSIGEFDDIQIFNRSLSDQEIKALYEAPNPNEFRNKLNTFFKISGVVVLIACIILVFNYRNKRALKIQKQQFELLARISELELKVIKTQMNPHFISNSLAAIQGLILQNDIDRASQYLAKFSYFMRQVLEYSEKNYVSVDEEIAIIKLNVELEQLRFKNDFLFEVIIENDLRPEDFLIPSLITHPFIENAIWHGLLPLEERAPRLKVIFYKKGNDTFLAIVDNGVGRAIKSEIPSRKSIGTSLASDKIDSINLLRNNSDFKLEIIDLFDENKKPCGTRIEIRLTSNAY
ncbi:MAG: histidine kinase [Bacteroidia bacterium]|nr:histidine kinase [Bacteroidia bacterium]